MNLEVPMRPISWSVSLFYEKNRCSSSIIHENFKPIYHRYKTGRASRICSITIEILFHSHIENFS